MKVFLFTDHKRQNIFIAWTMAILIHILLFSLTGTMFIKPSQFAIAPSHEIDIKLIDEPKEVIQVKRPQPVIKKIEKVIPKILKPVCKPIEKTNKVVMPKHLVIPKQVMMPSAVVKVEAKPDYIQNLPPPYPELAKQMHQEGIVMLSVDVNKEGDPVTVVIIQSSGYRMLDQSALKVVTHWKFQPGSIDNIPVDSMVTVPIRFRLKD